LYIAVYVFILYRVFMTTRLNNYYHYHYHYHPTTTTTTSTWPCVNYTGYTG